MHTTTTDKRYIRLAIEIARLAAQRGDNPYGAVLIGADGRELGRAANTQATDSQVLAHAEINLLLQAVKVHAPEVLAKSTLYASAEPCAMCAGALFWSGVGRLVFGISNRRLHEIQGPQPRQLAVSSRQVLQNAGRNIEIIGPVLEIEAESVIANN